MMKLAEVLAKSVELTALCTIRGLGVFLLAPPKRMRNAVKSAGIMLTDYQVTIFLFGQVMLCK